MIQGLCVMFNDEWFTSESQFSMHSSKSWDLNNCFLWAVYSGIWMTNAGAGDQKVLISFKNFHFDDWKWRKSESDSLVLL